MLSLSAIISVLTGDRREGCVQPEAELGVMPPQAKDTWSHRKLERQEGFFPESGGSVASGLRTLEE